MSKFTVYRIFDKYIDDYWRTPYYVSVWSTKDLALQDVEDFGVSTNIDMDNYILHEIVLDVESNVRSTEEVEWFW